MSNWTHVAGVIRVDYIKFGNDELDFDELIGKECLFDSPTEVWDDAETHPDKYLPMGSEGSLQKDVWVNPDSSYMARYTVSIFGDLRDHNSASAIINWFKDVCKKFLVRQAVITVRNERNGEITWTYVDKD